MGKTKRKEWTVADYDRAADTYCRSLPLEHFMEAPPQATQREVTVASFAILKGRRPDVQAYNELLIQYRLKGRLRRVVPDNMVRRSKHKLRSQKSFNVELETDQPLLVLEYVSANNERKDYRDSFQKYEQELRVPYCLIFHPDEQDLQLYHLEGDRYRPVPADAQGRHAIPDLELEVGLLEGWVRYWHLGELLSLPAELDKALIDQRQRTEQERQRAEQEKQRAEQNQQRAEQNQQRAEQNQQRAEQERQRAEQAEQRAAQAEAEIERLRALLGQGPVVATKPRLPRKPKRGS